MKTLVFSGYEPLNRPDVPPIFLKVSEYQKAWAESIGADYLYNTTDLISRFRDTIDQLTSRTRKISEDKGFSTRTRQGAVYADLSRIMWIKEHLKEYERVIWLDGDFLPLKGFNIPEGEFKAPHMLREMMMSNFDPETKKAKGYGQCRTVTCMQFTQDHLPYIEAHISLCPAISINSTIEKKDWWIYGTSLVSALDNLFKYPTIDGVGFVTPSSLKHMFNSIENTKVFFECYDEWWSKYECKTQGLNLSTNQDVDNLTTWIDLLDSNGYLR